MAQPKVSVIVPIYNVEKYIDKCLMSIQNQTFQDFEVLLINDETPDNSAKIAQTYCDKDSRFHLYHKRNGGLSDARNYGIAKAVGDYVVFIDSDDYLHKDYLEVMYHECVDNDADMSYCRFKYAFFGGKITFPMPISAAKEVMKNRDALNILIRDNYLHSYAWNKMYKRTLFTKYNITYPIMFFEDIATSGRLLYHSNKIAITDRYLYYYVKRFGSIMSTMDARKINDYIRSVLIVRNYIQKHGLYKDYKKSIHSFATKMWLVNIYSIIRQHVIHFDFRKMGYNLKTNRWLYDYILSEDYQCVPYYPDIPRKIHQPGRKKAQPIQNQESPEEPAALNEDADLG